MTPFQQRWVDEPIRSKDDDTLQRAHLAEHAARLMAGTHSWEASVVFGLTGPWGSGKTSLVELIVEELQKQSPEWRVARFTPWATSDTASLMAEFFAALEAALPKDRADTARQALKACATVAAPWLNLLPVVGAALGENAKALGEAAGRSKPWHQAFDDASIQLKELNTPVLVVADDIDRLQADELVALLKVVRLLGRFPGVHYLLAYDEQTLLENLQHAGVGVADAHRARLFMEKIVQYPLTVPPLLPHQMHWRLEEGLTTLFEDLHRRWDEDDDRIGHVLEVFESQLSTPRSIERLLAQLRHYLPLHPPAEINDVDLILLTFLHLQFPELYNTLPRWRATLTGTDSQHFLRARNEKAETDWGPLLALAPEGHARNDARRVLEELFPTMRAHSTGPRSGPRVCVPEYFNRYFAHTIPHTDIADTEIHAALTQASARGSNGEALIALLTEQPYPGRIDLVLSKLRALYAPELPVHSAPVVTVNLIRVVAGQLTTLDDSSRMLASTQDQGRYLLADLLERLPPTTVEELDAALGACTDWLLRAQILRTTLNTERASAEPPALEALQASAQSLSEEIGEFLLAHLRQGDDAELGSWPLTGFIFIRQFGAAEALRERIRIGIKQGRFTVEDLAARFVSTQYLLGGHTSVPELGGFEQDIFAAYAPPEAPLYALPREDVDTFDTSWTNRRTYTRGRAQPPTPPHATHVCV